jgi:hypothetical protein
MLVMVLVFGITVVGCDTDGNGNGSSNNPFIGKWANSGGIEITFAATNYAIGWPDHEGGVVEIYIRGTYIYTGNTATLSPDGAPAGMTMTATISGNTLILDPDPAPDQGAFTKK